MKKLYIINGASGSGKTTLVKSLAKKLGNFKFAHFDSNGVPSQAEMEAKFGTWENWQKATTDFWIQKIRGEFISEHDVVFDAHSYPAFIDDACDGAGIVDRKVIFLDCSDAERGRRLLGRNQPELASEQMMNWAKFLREESLRRGYSIIDNTNLSADETLERVLSLIS